MSERREVKGEKGREGGGDHSKNSKANAWCGRLNYSASRDVGVWQGSRSLLRHQQVGDECISHRALG